MRQNALILWKFAYESFDGSPDHGVFAHENYTLHFVIRLSQALSNFMHLLRRDIVHSDNEYRFMLL